MADLLWYQYALIGLIFAWSGFVRTSLGFGGAVLALPFLLLVVDEPLLFLPIIAIQLPTDPVPFTAVWISVFHGGFALRNGPTQAPPLLPPCYRAGD